MNFKKNKLIAYIYFLIILTSCTSSSKNLQVNTGEILNAATKRDIQEIYNYENFFASDLSILNEAIQSERLTQKQLDSLILLKKNYQKILSKNQFHFTLHPKSKYSKDIIRLIFKFQLPIKISWIEGSERVPNNLLSSKIDGYCSSIYRDSMDSIFKKVQIEKKSTLIIYSPKYKYLIKNLKNRPTLNSFIEFNSNKFQEFASNILEIYESEQRFEKISNLNPNQNLQFSPRPRSDFNTIVLILIPDDYKALVPALRYHGENKYSYLNFISNLENVNNPKELLDYEGSYSQLSLNLKKKIVTNKIKSLTDIMAESALHDWLIIQILKQARISSASINGMNGNLIYKANSCTKRKMPMSQISAALFNS